MQRAQNWTSIANIQFGKLANVVAVITDFKEPRLLDRTGDYMLWVAINDPSFQEEDVFFSINVFRADGSAFDGVSTDSWIIAFSNLKIQRYSEKLMGVAHKDTPFAIYGGPETGNKPLFTSGNSNAVVSSVPPSLLAELREFRVKGQSPAPVINIPSRTFGGPVIRPSPTVSKPSHSNRFGKKLCTYSAVEESTFFDIVLEVLSVRGTGSQTVLETTDYTATEYCEKRAETCGAVLPDNMLLVVTLWDNHHEWASQNVKEGDFVRLDNLKPKFAYGRMEASLHGDRQVKVKILSETDPLLSELYARKQSLQQTWNPKYLFVGIERKRPHCTIADALATENAVVKFCSVVKLEMTLPEDFSAYFQQLDENEGYVMFSIVVSDTTGALPLIFCKDDIKSLIPELITSRPFHNSVHLTALFLKQIHEIIGKTFEMSYFSYRSSDQTIRYRFLHLHSLIV